MNIQIFGKSKCFDTKKAETVDAVEDVVKKFARPLMIGAVDPDDPEKGIEALRKALKDAGMDELREAAQTQYEQWKNAQY